MKVYKIILGLILTSCIVSCSTNNKLNQEDAVKTIKEFLSKNPPPIYEGTFSVTSIEAVSQFTENEASIIVHNSISPPIDLKIIFKKNMDNKWVLNSIDEINNSGISPRGFHKWINNNQNLNFIVQ